MTEVVRGFFGPELFVFPFFILFWVGVVWLIVMLVRRDRTPPPAGPWAGPPRPAALDVLEERYARGEITREEFVERRTVLLGGHSGSAPAPPPPPLAPPPPIPPLAPPPPTP